MDRKVDDIEVDLAIFDTSLGCASNEIERGLKSISLELDALKKKVSARLLKREQQARDLEFIRYLNTPCWRFNAK